MRAWEKNIRRVEPYVPGEQPDSPKMIKLNTNENPYPPAPGVQAACRDFDAESLRLYPDPSCRELAHELAACYGLEDGQIFVGVGSDDVLAMAFLTFFNSDRPVLFPDITYSFYDVWADLFRIPFERPALDEEFRIRKEDYYRENGGIIFPNPNAPTSLFLPLKDVEDIVAHNQDSVVIIDEAYVDFADESALPLLKKYENLLVVQTFSKSRSMAGMRIGFACGSPRLIQAMKDVKESYNSYTMNRTSLRLGVQAVRDKAYFRETVERIIRTREKAKERMASLGFIFPDSQANFLFVHHPEKDAGEIFSKLKEREIYVRHWDRPRISGWLRITIGTEDQMERLYEALEEILKEK